MNKPIYPQVLYQFPKSAGERWTPSNGTEFMIWEEHFCAQCIHENPIEESDNKCDIITQNLVNGNGGEAWRYSNEGWPVCIKWQKWDWGNDGDPNDPDNPKGIVPPSNDPNQLLMPFDIWELLGVTDDLLVTKTAIIERELIEK